MEGSTPSSSDLHTADGYVPLKSIDEEAGRPRQEGEEKPMSPMEELKWAFDFRRNLQTMCFRRESGRVHESIDVLDFFRATAALWVLALHVWWYAGNMPPDFKSYPIVMEYYRQSDDWKFYPSNAGDLGVDQFFVLSGFLVFQMLYKDLERANGELSLGLAVKFLFRRFMRLWPALVLAIIISVAALGPRMSHCYEDWYIILTFVQNLVKPHGAGQLCNGVAWSVSIEFQFYLFSPLIIYWMYRLKKWAPVVVSGLVILGLSTALFNVYYFKMWTPEGWAHHFSYKLYFAPYVRCSAYAAGLLAAWIYFVVYRPKRSMQWPLWAELLGYAITIPIAALCMYGEQQLISNKLQERSRLVLVLVLVCERTAYAFSVAYCIIMCTTGHSKIFNTFASHALWYPFAQLSYSMYLNQFAVLYLVYNYIYPVHTAADLTYAGFWARFAITAPLAYSVAAVSYLFVEMPFMNCRNLTWNAMKILVRRIAMVVGRVPYFFGRPGNTSAQNAEGQVYQ